MAKGSGSGYTSPMLRILLIAACASAALSIHPALAAPISQKLQPTSSIKFGVQSSSPTLNMNGKFSDFRGELLLDPEAFEESSIRLSLKLDSIQLPPEQLIQALFIQTTLSRYRDRSGSFTSTSIRPLEDGRYLVTGDCTWDNRTRSTSVPVQVVSLSPSRSEIRFLLDGVVRPQDVKPEVAQIAPGIAGTKGWAKASLIFLPR